MIYSNRIGRVPNRPAPSTIQINNYSGRPDQETSGERRAAVVLLWVRKFLARCLGRRLSRSTFLCFDPASDDGHLSCPLPIAITASAEPWERQPRPMRGAPLASFVASCSELPWRKWCIASFVASVAAVFASMRMLIGRITKSSIDTLFNEKI
ncbi:hypothetical protein MUK42_34615 [Musa troglodytarum]|uniref:Uncharacterized protein n=1 Tax=Musa troglodytarum TaxID=320322 RepID=A0A9E7KZV3_9LILI|nr:hypothetical protein MUK42_34615 [Musa troglodytarum]